MKDHYTKRYSQNFSSLHPLIQSKTNEIIRNFIEIHNSIAEIDKDFVSSDVIQIILTDKVIFQILIESRRLTFDLVDVTKLG